MVSFELGMEMRRNSFETFHFKPPCCLNVRIKLGRCKVVEYSAETGRGMTALDFPGVIHAQESRRGLGRLY